MRRAWIWFWLSCKRYLHRISFLIILLLLPVGAFFIRGTEKREGIEIRIAVCVEEAEGAFPEEDGNALERQLLETLTSRKAGEGMFRFYQCADEEQVKAEVASRRAECGYVIGSGLRDKLNAKAYKRCVRVYSSPSTVTARLSSEVVFAALIRHYDRELFGEYVRSGGVFAPPAGQEELLKEKSGELYDAWAKDGGTFHFVYEQTEGGAYVRKTDETMLFPVRGIVAVYVFVAGLYGAAVSLTDERKGLYFALPAASRIPCQLSASMGPVVLAALSGLAALASGGCMGHPVRESAAMAGYVMAVTCYSWLLGRLCRKEAVICSLIPFFLIGSLVFCPVFVEIGRYLPVMGAAGRWFLPWYYLNLF